MVNKRKREKEPNDDKTPKQKQNDIYTTVIDLKEEIHTDQTGKFPHLYSKGNIYIMVAHNIDANYIFMDAMKNISESKMMACYQQIVSRMKKAGLTLRKHILDNEASAAHTALIEGNGMVWEFFPPGQHRRNITEIAIQTAKDYFVAILVGV